MSQSFNITDPIQKAAAIKLIQSIPDKQITTRTNHDLDDNTIKVDPDNGILELSPANARNCRFSTRREPKMN